VIRKFLVVGAIAASLVACAGANQSTAAAASPSTAPVFATATPKPHVDYRVKFDTSAGPFVVAVIRSEAPIGADHFLKLVKAKYYDGQRFYRVVPGFVVQWGSAPDPAVTKKWDIDIADDPVLATNTRGTITFADSGRNTRSTALFINFGNNARLDGMGFAPFGYVESGMKNVDRIYAGYGQQPDQGQIAQFGNVYLNKSFPKLDYIKTARVIK
jgi:peptidyl-prolyl cis-trans isomerase A (cyclophilin A)